MAFGGFTGTPGTHSRQLDLREPFPIIHGPDGPGSDAKARIVRKRWPEKIILLQDAYGGISGPRLDRVWPGHCLFKQGTLLTQDLGPNDTVLKVKETDRLVRSARLLDESNRKFPYALILYSTDAKGKPDWSHAEHVVLTRLINGSATIKRGQWGSKPLSFKAGKAVAAAHMMFWRRQWQLNFSLHGPRGGPGNLTAAEWYAREIAGSFRQSGADGIEFDVGRWTWGSPEGSPMDADNDLAPDYGYIDGVNSFGLGGQVFFRELRKLLGPDKIIQADSNGAAYGVRGWRYLNGVQLESFPAENQFQRFSEAFQHLRLWAENAEASPRFSYAFTKAPTTTFGGARLPNGASTNFRFRVGLASSLLVGMPHMFTSVSTERFDPANDVNGADVTQHGGPFAWDEYLGGKLNDWHWLRRPVAPAKQDLGGLGGQDLLNNRAWHWIVEPAFRADVSTGPVATAHVRKIPENRLPPLNWYGVRFGPAGNAVLALSPGKEYTLVFDARGDDMWHVAGATYDRVPRMVTIRGIAPRSGDHPGRAERPVAVLVDSNWRTYRISFTAHSRSAAELALGVSEQAGSTSFRNLRLFPGGSERWSREYENGIVLLNMTSAPWKYDLPKGKYRHIAGKQAPDVNNGEAVSGPLQVPPGDAVFLTKTGPN